MRTFSRASISTVSLHTPYVDVLSPAATPSAPLSSLKSFSALASCVRNTCAAFHKGELDHPLWRLLLKLGHSRGRLGHHEVELVYHIIDLQILIQMDSFFDPNLHILQSKSTLSARRLGARAPGVSPVQLQSDGVTYAPEGRRARGVGPNLPAPLSPI